MAAPRPRLGGSPPAPVTPAGLPGGARGPSRSPRSDFRTSIRPGITSLMGVLVAACVAAESFPRLVGARGCMHERSPRRRRRARRYRVRASLAAPLPALGERRRRVRPVRDARPGGGRALRDRACLYRHGADARRGAARHRARPHSAGVASPRSCGGRSRRARTSWSRSRSRRRWDEYVEHARRRARRHGRLLCEDYNTRFSTRLLAALAAWQRGRTRRGRLASTSAYGGVMPADGPYARPRTCRTSLTPCPAARCRTSSPIRCRWPCRISAAAWSVATRSAAARGRPSPRTTSCAPCSPGRARPRTVTVSGAHAWPPHLAADGARDARAWLEADILSGAAAGRDASALGGGRGAAPRGRASLRLRRRARGPQARGPP